MKIPYIHIVYMYVCPFRGDFLPFSKAMKIIIIYNDMLCSLYTESKREDF